MHANLSLFVSGNTYIYATIRRRCKQCSESRPRIILAFTRPLKNSSNNQMRIPPGSDWMTCHRFAVGTSIVFPHDRNRCLAHQHTISRGHSHMSARKGSPSLHAPSSSSERKTIRTIVAALTRDRRLPRTETKTYVVDACCRLKTLKCERFQTLRDYERANMHDACHQRDALCSLSSLCSLCFWPLLAKKARGAAR